MSNIDTINVGGVDFGIGGTPGLFYDSYEEAETDLANIEDGTLVYTPEPDSTIQDIIDGMTSLHLVGTQRGAGSTNVTVITESSKRFLAITKKSGVIVESKEIPTSVLESGDVVLLGNTSPVIGTETSAPSSTSYPLQENLVGKQLDAYSYLANNGGHTRLANFETSLDLETNKSIGLAADLSSSSGASITYNGSNSFTITVTDSTLSVYLYTDMLVLGGSASGRNVSFDASGTDLSSTDVEGAIKELIEKVRKESMPLLDFASPLHSFKTDGLTYTASEDCYLCGTATSNSSILINVNNTAVNTHNQYMEPLKLTSGDVVTLSAAPLADSLHIYKERTI